jgi:hypothetical protein
MTSIYLRSFLLIHLVVLDLCHLHCSDCTSIIYLRTKLLVDDSLCPRQSSKGKQLKLTKVDNSNIRQGTVTVLFALTYPMTSIYLSFLLIHLVVLDLCHGQSLKINKGQLLKN